MPLLWNDIEHNMKVPVVWMVANDHSVNFKWTANIPIITLNKMKLGILTKLLWGNIITQNSISLLRKTTITKGNGDKIGSRFQPLERWTMPSFGNNLHLENILPRHLLMYIWSVIESCDLFYNPALRVTLMRSSRPSSSNCSPFRASFRSLVFTIILHIFFRSFTLTNELHTLGSYSIPITSRD